MRFIIFLCVLIVTTVPNLSWGLAPTFLRPELPYGCEVLVGTHHASIEMQDLVNNSAYTIYHGEVVIDGYIATARISKAASDVLETVDFTLALAPDSPHASDHNTETVISISAALSPMLGLDSHGTVSIWREAYVKYSMSKTTRLVLACFTMPSPYGPSTDLIP
ncbi:MAG: hypothetical protein NDI61_13110 [Bdellovibrionaceae bacterium]|nr:hypothetical protein [Pseudobdellovibrionaceae bacterium]